MADIDISRLDSKPIRGDESATRKQWSGAKTIITAHSNAFQDTILLSVMDTDGNEIVAVRLDERMRVELIQALLEGK